MDELGEDIDLGTMEGGPEQGRFIDRRYVTATARTPEGALAMEALKPPSAGDRRGVGIMRTFLRSELARLALALQAQRQP